MAKLSISKKQAGKIVKLKVVVEKLLHKKLSIIGMRNNNMRSSNWHHEYEEESVPEDVKAGHFAVIAEDHGEEPKRFVVPLSCLTLPSFLRLLEEAAEEYGFDQEGALTIPCRPSEIENILGKPMVQSY